MKNWSFAFFYAFEVRIVMPMIMVCRHSLSFRFKLKCGGGNVNLSFHQRKIFTEFNLENVVPPDDDNSLNAIDVPWWNAFYRMAFDITNQIHCCHFCPSTFPWCSAPMCALSLSPSRFLSIFWDISSQWYKRRNFKVHFMLWGRTKPMLLYPHPCYKRFSFLNNEPV